MENWLPEMKITEKGKDQFLAHLILSADSPWFRGHFPGKPILPAVAIIFIVLLLLRKAMKKQDLYLKAIPRSRIRGILLPGEEIEVHCKIKEQSSEQDPGFLVTFQVNRDGQRVGDGKMEIEERGVI